MIPFLSDTAPLPNPLNSESDIIAFGGGMNSKRLFEAYTKGIFPWYNKDEPITWYAPNPRFVLFPNELKISKSLKKILRTNSFSVTVNKAFKDVMLACAKTKRKNQSGTWIQKDMVEAYTDLHKKGYAKSIEVWEDNKLIGGLYGVEMKQIFFGESMYYKKTDASKVALVYLVQNESYKIIDCQVYTNHLASLGARNISLQNFLNFLQ